MNNWFQKQWTSYSCWHVLLIPLSWVYLLVITIRKFLYRQGWLKSTRLSVPVIVVGNITVGGTGKTPFVIWLAEQLKRADLTPGIVSRGYGGQSKAATEVLATSNAEIVGDEPVLIAKRTGCPMFVGVDRAAASMALLRANPQCNVIISDDGLQHYALQRDVEIGLINSDNKFGNQQLLPAGPLRERISRLQKVDVLVDSGNSKDEIFDSKQNNFPLVFKMKVEGKVFESLESSMVRQSASFFLEKDVIAIAGIGNPERFFNLLSNLGLQFERQVFPDHYAFTAQDLKLFSGKTVLMTEKDAVKCAAFSMQDAWYLPIAATVGDVNQIPLMKFILQKLRS